MMMRSERVTSLRTLLGAATLALLALPAQAAPDCGKLVHDGNSYTVCTLRADRDEIRLFHSDAQGRLLGSFSAIDSALEPEGKQLTFAMNAGMYHDDRSPVGLYLDQGVQSGPLVTRDGPGNFGLLPNGIFCLKEHAAAVIESRSYAADAPRCTYATQSGPMLVIDGKLHPRFLENGSSRYIRNGVGVAADGVTVYFAISDNRVNFHSFGRLFRDELKTPNALYFDGKVSRLHAPSIGRSDSGFPLGPIVGAVGPDD
ncbi:phosphodiester glycosidase family protein [Tropicimonas sp. TH_r6]|uniref:phosphodiester glycosidase family protein n=1 Tax=Tropicimonas sp. TH_r6 TaxID=3082085 RepID=UPI0029536D8B|nr:phosphodiester glycosidase family protein [Tropicimonas sp. TH_r6]MDV7141211.1 phosphodiester glycosidase family protein [Tropicimonas sp. TH_r6]